jgi:hypothetical protein
MGFCWRPYSAGVHSVSDQPASELTKLIEHPNKNLGGEGASDR